LPQIVCIFEDKKFSNFFPMSLSQPVFDLRVGTGTLRSRLQDEFAEATFTVLCREYLAPLTRIRLRGVTVNETTGQPTVFVNGRLLCFGNELTQLLDELPENGIAVKGGYVVAARLGAKAAADFAAYIGKRISEETIAALCDELRAAAAATESKPDKRRKLIQSQQAEEGTYEDAHLVGQDSREEKLPVELTRIIAAHKMHLNERPEARLLSFPWQLIEFNPDVIADDFRRLPFRGQSEESVVYPGVQLINDDEIVIGDGAAVKSGVVLDASGGPIVIGDRAVVMPNATVIGPVSIGADSLVKAGAKILEGTSTGTVCKIGGEVEGTIFGSYSNKQHDGFIGHSYLGEWVNIGAASNNSDLKNNYSAVRMWCAGRVRETGRQFMGLLMGDHTKTGINTLFNTGTVIGFNCNVFSAELPAAFVPSYSWGHGREMGAYELDKAMHTAAVVLERRRVRFEVAHRTVFEKIHDMSVRAGRNL
jgi:UDP-N-acetylglucosamine diphosphorylase/glucosamine-1-phosphate N-acetyltransferase